MKTLKVLVLVNVILFFAGCTKNNNANLQYGEAVLGGCNLKSVQKSDDEGKNDAVIITTSKDSIHIFVGLNYTCKADPFETRCEIINDIVYMHLIDSCHNIDYCYFKCMCYYTFDFLFKRSTEGGIDCKYNVILDNLQSGNSDIIFEGIIRAE